MAVKACLAHALQQVLSPRMARVAQMGKSVPGRYLGIAAHLAASVVRQRLTVGRAVKLALETVPPRTSAFPAMDLAEATGRPAKDQRLEIVVHRVDSVGALRAIVTPLPDVTLALEPVPAQNLSQRMDHVERMARLAQGQYSVIVVRQAVSAAAQRDIAIRLLVVNLALGLALGRTMSQSTECVERTAKRARDQPLATAVPLVDSAAHLLHIVPPAARPCLVLVLLVQETYQLTVAVERTERHAKARPLEIAVLPVASAASQQITAAPVVRRLSGPARVLHQAVSQLMENVDQKMGRLVSGQLLGIAVRVKVSVVARRLTVV